MQYSIAEWTLPHHNARPEQIDIINEILEAIANGYTNIILEAGTGIGKSAIATTVSNYVKDSYIITMTNQLLTQYLQDFSYMVNEIKGKSNYECLHGGSCEECDVTEQNQKLIEAYIKALHEYNKNPKGLLKPEKPEKLLKCEDCPYKIALKDAIIGNNIITNYDFLHLAGNYAKMLPERELIIFDESHNFEKKVMQLIVKTLNRKVIYHDYQIDIFDGLVDYNMTLKDIKKPEYWIGVCEKIISIIQDKRKSHIDKTYKGMDFTMLEECLKLDENVQKFDMNIKKYNEVVRILTEEKWIIELPTKKDILADESYLVKSKEKGLTVTFKPLTIVDYSESLLHFGKIRLFMTGTLGNKEMFCKWTGIDPDDTYYIYKKSPFPVENRPIMRDYAGYMSGWNKRLNKPNWKNDDALIKIHDILEQHTGEKGVIHVSSNEQAWWIFHNIREYTHRHFLIAYGREREDKIREFEDSEEPVVLLGAGIKDGVDFKGDKCRFQILFKMPFPSLDGAQVNIRKRHDPVWYVYQTVMPLMQAYGRGIRDMTDYCKTYVLDRDFDDLLENYGYLFNEYFLEAIEDLKVIKKSRRVKRVPAGAK